jgi:hypothetical protein
MRSFVVALTVLVALALGGTRAEAYGWYPWCAWFPDNVAGGGCYFTSLQACWTTVRGVGGYCGINPYPPPPTTQRYRRRHHRRYYR